MIETQLPLTPQTSTFNDALADFKAVYMAARNYSPRTRGEYESDIEDLGRFLVGRHIGAWAVVGLHDLQGYLADLDRRGLSPASRNRKTHAIKTFFGFLYQSGYIRTNPAGELMRWAGLSRHRNGLD